MMETKKRRPGAGTPKAAKAGQYIAKIFPASILALYRAAVKLAIAADLVLLLAALGSLNIPGTLTAVLALNALCGLREVV